MGDNTKYNIATPELIRQFGSLFSYLNKRLGLQKSPSVRLVNDNQNATDPFGKTAYYDNVNNTIVLYITNRHNTDILRSFAHEIIHHWQRERGALKSTDMGPHYAQNNPDLRKREMEAYLFGNILFRDWQDENRFGTTNSPLLPKPFNENLQLGDGRALKNQIDQFVKHIVNSNLLTSYHRKLTSGDMDPKDFEEDLSHKILSAIISWTQTVNNRGNWENQPDMIK